jgi:long-chain acyl-CoA synthetase
VKDCVVIGLDRGGNAEACPVLILRNSADPARVVARANEQLAEFQRMHTWFVWPDQDFPRTSTQKPKTAVIKETVQSGLEGTSPQTATTPLARMIAQITGRAPGNLSADSNLEADLNLSSLDRVELMSALEDRYQVDLSETSFASAHTVGDLEKMLRGEAASRVNYHYPRWALASPVRWLRLAAHYLLLRPAVFLLGWPQVYGREHLSGVRGPVLVICNHISDVDVGFVLTALPAHLRDRLAIAAGGEAMEILRTPPAHRRLLGRACDRVKWVLGAALLNLFPLPREAGFRQSFEYAGEAVDRGYSVLIFPEGQHTTTGRPIPFRAGIGILVNSLDLPVVPMRINGLYELKQSGKKLARPGQISVRIGEPMKFGNESAPAQIAETLQQKVENL